MHMIIDSNLEQRIQELSLRAVAAKSEKESRRIIAELQELLRKHSRQAKVLLAKYPFDSTKRAA